MIKIAIDTMGGDNGIYATIGGISCYLQTHKNTEVFFNLFGNSVKLEEVLGNFPIITKNLYTIYHTNKVISNDIKIMSAFKLKEGTSMYEAINSVANKENDAVVSAGNTGVYMAISKMLLNTIEGIDRPALMTILPTLDGRGNVALDLGANMDCNSTNLLQFAIMGNAVAKAILALDKPKIGLLNVGTEKTKGTDAIKEAYQLISSYKSLNFIGFIEGTDVTKNTADVLVADGFSGNILIKSMEGAFKYIAHIYEREVRSSLLGKLSYVFNLPILNKMKKIIDTRNYNGASFVGLNGIAIKSHGSSDARGFANAISVAVKLVQADFIENIKNSIEQKI